MSHSTEQTPLLSHTTSSATPVVGVHYATLRRFLVYQLASLLSTVDGLAGTFTLRQFNAQALLAATYGATLDFHQGWMAGLLLTLTGALSSVICVVVFLVMMLHPSHHETRGSVYIKEIIFSVVFLALLGVVIYATVIVATEHATLYTPGLPNRVRQEILTELGSLHYKDSLPALLFVICGWILWLTLGASLFLVSTTGRHVLKHGPVLDAQQDLPERLAHRYLGPILAKAGFTGSAEPSSST